MINSDENNNDLISFKDNDFVDLGRLFHEHSTTLNTLLKALDPVFVSFGKNPFEHIGEPSIEEIEEMLKSPLLKITELLEIFIQNIEDDSFRIKNDVESIDRVFTIQEELSNYRSKILSVLRPSFIRELMRKIINIFEELLPLNLKIEQIENIIKLAKAIELIVCFYDLTHAKTRILAMQHQTQTLQDFLTRKVRDKEEFKTLKLGVLLGQVIRNHEEFSKQKRVELRLVKQNLNTLVTGRERDLKRAFSNILHNCIKYSWRMARNEFAWVYIRCYKTNNKISIEFESWGVPIEKDEIESKSIFRLGERGTHAIKDGRLGDGIGLWDSEAVANDHKGYITVISNPARSGDSRPIDRRPFVTKVIFAVPFYAELPESEFK